MKLTKRTLLEKTIEIVTAYCRGGGGTSTAMLASVYKQLVELNDLIDD